MTITVQTLTESVLSSLLMRVPCGLCVVPISPFSKLLPLTNPVLFYPSVGHHLAEIHSENVGTVFNPYCVMYGSKTPTGTKLPIALEKNIKSKQT